VAPTPAAVPKKVAPALPVSPGVKLAGKQQVAECDAPSNPASVLQMKRRVLAYAVVGDGPF